MCQRTLRTHANRRYRAGARLALLATLLVGVAASGLIGSRAPTVEISHHRDAAPAPTAVEVAPLPDPEIEPASLPIPPALPSEPAASLHVDRAVDFAPAAAPMVERLVL